MLIPQLLFYLFASVLVASSVAMIFARHPVHAVLFLILAFFNAAGLFLLQGAEFLAMILIIVYVGAIAVFFLFVVMMLDAKIIRSKGPGQRSFLIFALIVGALLAGELIFVALQWPEQLQETATSSFTATNHHLAQVLYTEYGVAVVVTGMILLAAMIGAIVITIRHRPNVKRQNIHNQNTRPATIRLTKPPFGRGLS